MSSRCNEFNELLLELAYEELDETTARRLLQHKDKCGSCLQAYTEIAGVRSVAQTIEAPQIPSHFDADILSMAKQAAEEFKTQQTEHSIHPPVHVPSQRTFVERVQAFIFKPPVYGLGLAAAAVLIAVVSLQNDHHSTMLDPEDGSPFVGATKVVPPEELPATEQDRILENESKKETVRPNIQKAGPNYQMTMEERSADDYKLKEAPSSRSRNAPQDATKNAATTPNKKTYPLKIQKNPADLLGQNTLGTARGSKLNSKPSASGPQTPIQYDAGPQEPPMRTTSKQSRAKKDADSITLEALESADEGGANEAQADIDVDDTTDFFKNGLSAYNSGDCKRAIYNFQKMLDADNGIAHQTSAATHYIAKCEKRTGRCGKALISYERLLKQYYGYGKRDEALYEAATCHKKLGHTDRARELLNELSLNPNWKAKAESELNTLKK